MKSTAATPDEYLAELPPERREALAAVRALVRANLPAGYEERMNWGMLSYEIPLARYPDTYNGQPLQYVALAAQKRHLALYLMGLYGDADAEARLRAAFEAAGLAMDLGKSCLRFRDPAALPLDAVAAEIARLAPDDFIARYEAARRGSARGA